MKIISCVADRKICSFLSIFIPANPNLTFLFSHAPSTLYIVKNYNSNAFYWSRWYGHLCDTIGLAGVYKYRTPTHIHLCVCWINCWQNRRRIIFPFVISYNVFFSSSRGSKPMLPQFASISSYPMRRTVPHCSKCSDCFSVFSYTSVLWVCVSFSHNLYILCVFFFWYFTAVLLVYVLFLCKKYLYCCMCVTNTGWQSYEVMWLCRLAPRILFSLLVGGGGGRTLLQHYRFKFCRNRRRVI